VAQLFSLGSIANMSPLDSIKVKELLSSWLRAAALNEAAQYAACKWFGRLHYYVGIPVVVFSTSVASSVFSKAEDAASSKEHVVLGVISVLAAVLAGIQTFLGLSERSEKHRAAGASFADIGYEIEQCLACDLERRADAEAVLDSIRTRIGMMIEQAPAVPEHLWERESRLQLQKVKPLP
jgi:hypothetical protein